jgi:hypothetical protein
MPEAAECHEEKPGTNVCKGDEVRRCGPDTVDSTLVQECPYGCALAACREVALCEPGFDNCDDKPDCETDLSSSAKSCGKCGNACAGLPQATGTCTMGKCACETSFADCTAAPGCETYLDTDAANCGACGNVCNSGKCAAGGCALQVFATSALFKGDLGGVAGADQKCQTLAAAAKLKGTFRAWLGDSKTPISARFKLSDSPYVRTDGVQVAKNWTALTTAFFLDSSISVDEDGEPLATRTTPVWTGQALNNTVKDCEGWTSAVPNVNGSSGRAEQIDGGWQRYGYSSCGEGGALFCFEVSVP